MSTGTAAPITSVLKEARVFPPSSEFSAQAHIKSTGRSPQFFGLDVGFNGIGRVNKQCD